MVLRRAGPPFYIHQIPLDRTVMTLTLPSLSIAKSWVYTGPIAKAAVLSLDDRDKEDARTIAQERIALAGARLANLINDAPVRSVKVGPST
jgi:hypothetical protein